MHENDIAEIILDVAFNIHRTLGPGLLESIYEDIIAYELSNTYNLKFGRQVPICVSWKNVELAKGFRVDIIVEDKVLIEIKSVEKLIPVHAKQVQTYLKVTGIKLALLINFNEELLKHGIKRIVNGLDLD